MDPLSATASVIAILQLTGTSAQVFKKLVSLPDAPLQLQQLWNEAEALRALLLETEGSLQRRRNFDGYAQLEASITPVLATVRTNVREFEHLVHSRLSRNNIHNDRGLPKVNRSYWLRAGPDIERIKTKIQQSREILTARLELLGLDNSEDMKTRVLQIQRITLTNQDTIRGLEARQRETQVYLKQRDAHADATFNQMQIEQRRNFATLQANVTSSMQASMQPLLTQMEQMTVAVTQQTQIRQSLASNAPMPFSGSETSQNGASVRISTTITSEQCPRGCKCQCHTHSAVRTPMWLRSVFGQLFWNYSSSISIRSCNYAPCRKSLGKYHFTYYFPPWLVSRAVVASANLGDLFGAGAKVMVNIPLIIPEEDHIIWKLVTAGNMEQLRDLLSQDKNLMHVKNQWGQSIMHVAAKIHQPAVFNFLLSIGIDEHQPDENLKTAATTVLTRRGSGEYALKIDTDDLADRLGWTSLHKAAALIRDGYQITEALLESEYHFINSRDAMGRTPLHWLAENGGTEAIRLLTQDPWRADVHTRDIMGFTALHCACWADSLDAAAVLLDAGSNPNAKDKHERTPLLHFDDHMLLDLIIEKGADVHISDDEGCNIMHHVSISDQAALAKILLEQYGHSLCTTNYNGDTPLGLAIQNNSFGVLEVILPLLGDFPIEKLGIANLSRRNPLHLAALYASTETMDMLAAANIARLDAICENEDKDGHSPNECFITCRNEHCAVARKPSDQERRSWVRLIKSVRGEVIDFGLPQEHESTNELPEYTYSNCKDSFWDAETINESESEDEFEDAKEEYEDAEEDTHTSDRPKVSITSLPKVSSDEKNRKLCDAANTIRAKMPLVAQAARKVTYSGAQQTQSGLLDQPYM